MNSADHAQVVALIERYFEGLYHADSSVLRQVFHPNLAYVCATEGDELYLDLDTYMSRVDGRVPPAKRGDPRDEAILEIAFGSQSLAKVTARMSMMGRDYLDYLTLIRHGGEWRIVTKAFTYIPRRT
ncbi:nuclear transport factor 2 family protein [Falsihalocynthiibacter sp. BN13B15]|uniref:nuclear transport factor 2 family protein n=1 Tax=Falsihalocynthiibacter sp. BN13B15 TaxID=3240871 RepID=UPI0035103479